MTKNLENKLEIHSHVLAIHNDWDLKSTWKMVKPNLYKDENGEYQCKPFDRIPDGPAHHWDIVLVRGDRAYEKVSEEECNCDLTSGEICPHWRELR